MNGMDWTGCDIVEQVPGKVSGQPVVKGTRILAETIVEDFELGSSIEEIHEKAVAFRKEVFAAMADLRKEVDALERILPADFYPYPTYEDLLFRF